MKNLELKAVAPDLARLRRALRALGALRQPTLAQTDTYFTVPSGRLKVRQQKGVRSAELILYARPNASRARTSEYQKLAADDPAGLLRLLAATFPRDVVVRKVRDLWMAGTTRVHLDRVQGLGTFVEIEVPYRGPIAGARRTMATLVDVLGLAPGDVLDRSYADLLAGR
jgi:predicted adenylyl cyclase CyaB